MTNLKTTKRALFSSVIALLLCFTMLLGTTFAWFTDSVTSGINTIRSGNLDVELWHSSYQTSAENSQWGVGFGYSEDAGEKVNKDTMLFLSVDNQTPILWEPGATAVENFRIINEGSVALKFMFKLQVANGTKTEDGKDLADIIQLYIDEITYAENGVPQGKTIVAGEPLNDGYVIDGELLPNEHYDFWIGLEWEPTDNDNDYNIPGGHSIDIGVALVATQISYEKDGVNGDSYDSGAEYPEITPLPDKWDGTADTSWYDPENPQTQYTFTTAEQVMGLSELCSGNTTFAGVTFKLATDLDLYCEDTTPSADGDPLTFRPIGDKSKNGTFEGIFDGNGKTISNLYQAFPLDIFLLLKAHLKHP